ncbi:MAG: molybdopterin molybdotransferase MoeA [Planctomycetota bacterium]|nr:molybdopterin molybdotransferase MoeA [Planctomycetota bacterium]
MNATGDYATHEMDSCCQPNSTHLSYDEALQVLDNHCRNIQHKTEHIPLAEAVHRVLAIDVVLDRDEPPLARSAMDGFAVLNCDGVALREIVAVNYAGDVGKLSLNPGQAIKVMTGASVPTNADAVVMVENCRVDGMQLTITELPHKPHIRQIGDIASSGEVAVKANQIIGAGEMATLASCGVSTVEVYRSPRVSIVSTGNEVVPYAGDVLDHQTRDSNRLMLEVQLQQFGACVIESIHVLDDISSLSAAIGSLLPQADILITIGGVSMGDKDYLPQVFSQLEIKQLFHKVSMRPGKPIWAGYHQQTLVLGLPGNPVSSFVGSILFARPIVDAFLGCFGRRVTPRLAVSGSEFKSKSRSDFIVARFDDSSKVVASISSGSADWRSLTSTQVLALVPPNSIIAVDDQIEIIPV